MFYDSLLAVSLQSDNAVLNYLQYIYTDNSRAANFNYLIFNISLKIVCKLFISHKICLITYIIIRLVHAAEEKESGLATGQIEIFVYR